MKSKNQAEAAGASKALKNATKRIASMRGIVATFTNSPGHDFKEIANGLEDKIRIMTQRAIDEARAQGKPFRNPYVAEGERLYAITYPA